MTSTQAEQELYSQNSTSKSLVVDEHDVETRRVSVLNPVHPEDSSSENVQDTPTDRSNVNQELTIPLHSFSWAAQPPAAQVENAEGFSQTSPKTPDGLDGFSLYKIFSRDIDSEELEGQQLNEDLPSKVSLNVTGPSSSIQAGADNLLTRPLSTSHGSGLSEIGQSEEFDKSNKSSIYHQANSAFNHTTHPEDNVVANDQRSPSPVALAGDVDLSDRSATELSPGSKGDGWQDVLSSSDDNLISEDDQPSSPPFESGDHVWRNVSVVSSSSEDDDWQGEPPSVWPSAPLSAFGDDVWQDAPVSSSESDNVEYVASRSSHFSHPPQWEEVQDDHDSDSSESGSNAGFRVFDTRPPQLSPIPSDDDAYGQNDNHRPYGLNRNGGSGVHQPSQRLRRSILSKTKKDVLAALAQVVHDGEEGEKSYLPRHRPVDVVQLQKFIREHAKLLFKDGVIDPNTGEVGEITIVGEAECARYGSDRRNRDGPSLDRFWIDISSLTSKWNKHLAVVFANDFVSCQRYGSLPEQKPEISKMFLTHLKTVRKEVMDRRNDDPVLVDRIDRAVAMARDQRRRNLMDRRRRASESQSLDPDMANLYELLCRLPHSVCSGDESAHEGGKIQYAITSTDWRAPVLRYIFRVLDRVHISTRFKPDGRVTRGAFPHIRVISSRKDDIGPPPGLPENFFKPEYLLNLDMFEREALDLKPAVTISFPPRVIVLSERFSRVKDRHSKPLPVDDPSLPRLQDRQYFLNADR